MDKRYEHQQYEENLYQAWEKADLFAPQDKAVEGKKPFTIIMPPPNANDPLHIGHAMFIAIEDVLIRYHRMLGDDTLWLPGTDHAGIETQFVFEKKLKKIKQSRFNFDRETLYQMIWDYVQENSKVAVKQMKKIGASADWSRFKFMLEPKIVDTVLKTFQKLHKDKLVYREEKLVNFCPHCGTSFSELEVVYKNQTIPLYYVKYLMVDDPTQHITVATVRPEPIFADTHLAVHPDNKKTKHLIGKKVLNPLTNKEMEIIADEFVDPEFGTGIVKLTPAHDHNDFEIAKKLDLPINSAINLYGKITKNGGEFAGMRIYSARKAVVKKLQEKNLIEKIDEGYQNRIGTCYRCSRPIEPLLLPQFFIKVKPLTKPILEKLEAGEFKVYGAGHDKILKHWLENLRDWNISRQIVWGIRMPIWYKASDHPKALVTFLNKNQEKEIGKLGEFLENGHSLEEISKGLQELRAPVGAKYEVSVESPGKNYIQETDTFDTWFSSAQWPFTTLMAGENKPGKETDFQRFYPTQVMETGYDILPFWVMRMLMMGQYVTGELPFKDIYLHGLVRDAKGQKMSKSKGNVVNPLEITEKYGADALRMALVIRSSAGLDKSVAEQDFKAMRNLTNKIWNASRFILEFLDLSQEGDQKTNNEFKQKLEALTRQLSKNLDSFQIGLAAETTYNEFWHWFCDEAIEIAKEGKLGGRELLNGLITFMKLLHPYVPFVTEAVWQEMHGKKLVEDKWLITSSWPG